MRVVLVTIGLIAIAGGWYLFRPDALVLDRRVDEPPPVALTPPAEGAAALLAVGEFHGVSHAGSGRATIHRGPSGERMLRLSELAVDNGPDLYVYLVAAPDAWDDSTVENSATISLGRLKGHLGNQNYAIPPDADLERYRSVTIWCRRFGVNFATAPLMK
jgi:hypothetical protein